MYQWRILHKYWHYILPDYVPNFPDHQKSCWYTGCCNTMLFRNDLLPVLPLANLAHFRCNETVKHTPSVLTYKVGSIYNRKGILSNQVWYQTCMTSTQVWYSKLNRVKTSLIFNVYNVNTSLIYTCNIVALYQHHSDIQRLYRQYKSDNSTFDGMYCSNWNIQAMTWISNNICRGLFFVVFFCFFFCFVFTFFSSGNGLRR